MSGCCGRDGRSGVGTVTFGEPEGLLGVIGGARTKSPQVTIVLAAVPEAERVRDLIARAQSAA